MPIDKVKFPNGETEDIRDSRIPGIDSAPTAGSANLVTSGGVKSALDGKMNIGGVVSDFNTETTPGNYAIDFQVSANRPSINYGQALVLNAATDTVAQLAFNYNSGSAYFRGGSQWGSTWNSWREFAFKDDLSGYLPLTGGTMSGAIVYPGSSYEIIRTGGSDTTWRGGLKYSWTNNTTIALWGKNNMSQFVWHAGTDFSENDVNGTVTRNYDFQVGRNGTGSLEALVGGNLIWHQGNDGSGSGLDADLLDGKHATDFAYEWTAYAGGTHVGWEKIVEFPLNSENQFSSTNLILTLGRQYASPAPESYTILISIGWCSATLQVLNSNVNTQIMERFRVAIDSTNHKLYFEYYVNTDFTTYTNPVKCKIYGDNQIGDIALMGEPDASPDSLSEVTAIYLPQGNARIYGDFGAVTGTGISPTWSDRWDSGGRYRPWYGLDIPTDTSGVVLSGYYGIHIRTGSNDIYIGGGGSYNDNIGIGTSTPSTKLDVNGILSATAGLFGGANGVNIGATYAGSPLGAYDLIERAQQGGTLYFQYNHAGSISMCQGGGNVGIGTSSPAYKLDVNGSAAFGSSGSCDVYLRRAGLNYIHADAASNGAIQFTANSNNVMMVHSRGVSIGHQYEHDYALEVAGDTKSDSLTTTLQTSEPSGGMLPNREYQLGTLSGNTTFTLAAGTSGVTNHYFWSFETGSTAPTITWPSGITSWYGGSAPTINANKHYEVSVLNGVAVVMEV